jgi:hypothetical protein
MSSMMAHALSARPVNIHLEQIAPSALIAHQDARPATKLPVSVVWPISALTMAAARPAMWGNTVRAALSHAINVPGGVKFAQWSTHP